MTRITTNSILRGYQTNLNRSNTQLAWARNRVMTGQNFSTFAEDPASCTRMFKMMTDFSRVADQLNNSSTLTKKFEQAISSTNQIDEQYNKMKEDLLKAINDPSAGGRVTIGESLKSSVEAMVQTLNAQYNDNFVFAGADADEVPFKIVYDDATGDIKDITYRGISVNGIEGGRPTPPTQPEGTRPPDGTPEPNLPASPLKPIEPDVKDYTGPDDPNYIKALEDYKTALGQYNTALDQYNKDKAEYDNWHAWNQYDTEKAKYDKDLAEYDKAIAVLDKMAKETTYVDIGLGLQLDDDGNVIKSSAFNSSISGLDLMGYGTDENGNPKNLMMVFAEASNILRHVDSDSGELPAETKEKLDSLAKAMESSHAAYNQKRTYIDDQTNFIKNNTKRLEDSAYSINEQYLEIAQPDMAEAIMTFSWAQYSYNAALKVGNSILSQSFIDYMR